MKLLMFPNVVLANPFASTKSLDLCTHEARVFLDVLIGYGERKSFAKKYGLDYSRLARELGARVPLSWKLIASTCEEFPLYEIAILKKLTANRASSVFISPTPQAIRLSLTTAVERAAGQLGLPFDAPTPIGGGDDDSGVLWVSR